MVEHIPPNTDRRDDFVISRGGSKDTRSMGEKPYSPASYSAQYGIPVEDAEKYVNDANSHGEVMMAISRFHLRDNNFRYAALNHARKPYGEWSDGEIVEADIQKTTRTYAERYVQKQKGRPEDAVKSMPGVEGVEVENERRKRGES